MAIDFGVRSIRLTFGGSMYTSETWSVGLRITGVEGALIGIPNLGDLELFTHDRIAEVAAKVEAYWTGLAGELNGKAKLAWCKMAAIDTDGTMSDTGIAAVNNYPTPAAGGGGDAYPQLALAVSLLTGVPRGRAHSGRMYLPIGAGVTPDTNGRISSGFATTFADNTAVFINTLNDWAGVDPAWGPNVHIMSGLDGGTRHKVTGVRVGRTVDTQRRRRIGITEQYIEATTVIA
jgi:hypothetical protein